MKLTKILNGWATANAKKLIKTEIEKLSPESLPLQQGLSQSSYVSDDPIHAMILNISEQPQSIQIKVGIFFTGLIPGCNCADDPSSADEKYTEHCELQFDIDKTTAETVITLLSDETHNEAI